MTVISPGAPTAPTFAAASASRVPRQPSGPKSKAWLLAVLTMSTPARRSVRGVLRRGLEGEAVRLDLDAALGAAARRERALEVDGGEVGPAQGPRDVAQLGPAARRRQAERRAQRRVAAPDDGHRAAGRALPGRCGVVPGPEREHAGRDAGHGEAGERARHQAPRGGRGHPGNGTRRGGVLRAAGGARGRAAARPRSRGPAAPRRARSRPPGPPAAGSPQARAAGTSASSGTTRPTARR